MLLTIKNKSKRKEGEADARWRLREVEGQGRGKDARDLSLRSYLRSVAMGYCSAEFRCHL
ncbi:hypothetical protein NC651_016169 [Populus alba x Populus x berolinensis]|nr:hypothetical protein NC651_016169 [Populus alba x Populus x berolinensis]